MMLVFIQGFEAGAQAVHSGLRDYIANDILAESLKATLASVDEQREALLTELKR